MNGAATGRRPFMTAGDHFRQLTNLLDTGDRELFDSFRCVRVETGYSGRNFLVYNMLSPSFPAVLDKLTILDLEVSSEVGPTTEIRSAVFGTTQIVGCAPQRMFGYPVFMWMPLRLHVNVDCIETEPGDLSHISVGFNLCIKTLSRRSPQEMGVTHCETGKNFAEQIGAHLDPFGRMNP